MKIGLFPHELKHVDIIPINKEKDKYNKENYCPLSILRNLSKNVKNVCTINQSINQSFFHNIKAVSKKSTAAHSAQHCLLVTVY